MPALNTPLSYPLLLTPATSTTRPLNLLGSIPTCIRPSDYAPLMLSTSSPASPRIHLLHRNSYRHPHNLLLSPANNHYLHAYARHSQPKPIHVRASLSSLSIWPHALSFYHVYVQLPLWLDSSECTVIAYNCLLLNAQPPTLTRSTTVLRL